MGPVVFLDQVRLSVICTLRKFMFPTLCIVAPLMLRGVCLGCNLLKLKVISLVWSTWVEQLGRKANWRGSTDEGKPAVM